MVFHIYTYKQPSMYNLALFSSSEFIFSFFASTGQSPVKPEQLTNSSSWIILLMFLLLVRGIPGN
ncbi:hypothetical protein QBC41DRAFT_327591 [Cercophora samala]|uniref:Uncharacterized protein n=1 Tax=Cercophora samala TaxID=330535 RepID=A0AA39Z7J6_9PEZI|nr:hypothetical protein QBC41DRAFT_327591 [Cercophora samala]